MVTVGVLTVEMVTDTQWCSGWNFVSVTSAKLDINYRLKGKFILPRESRMVGTPIRLLVKLQNKVLCNILGLRRQCCLAEETGSIKMHRWNA